MANKIIENRRCVIIAGAPGADAEFVAQTVRRDDFVICADSGYDTAERAGVKPDLIVGDFDSFDRDALPADCEIIELKPDKNDTDTFHCVEVAFERGFTHFVLLASTGGRLDHTLANLSVLDYIDRRGGEGIILSKNESIRVLAVGYHDFRDCSGQTFSVMPFGCDAVTLSYIGAKYPLNRETLFHSVARGVSNVFIGDKSEIKVHSGKAVLIIENSV